MGDAESDVPGMGAASGLTDELMRRLSLRETITAAVPNSLSVDHRDVSRHPRLFCEERHDAGDDGKDRAATDGSLVLKWRQKEKLKTTAVALVLCLNIGVDPPDVIKISPCARLECWVDPNSMQPAKALEAIGKNLQAQYERWQPKAKYKMHLDPTMDDVKKLAQSSRRNAKAERVLFHYNGHGVPRPTANGELWVFNQRYTQYIPMSVYDLHTWLGTPAIYVLDCSSAGILINTFRNLMDQRHMEMRGMPQTYPGLAPLPGAPSDPMREIIVLAACGANEVLPQSPELPADVFTACLTTPIKVALRWFASRSLLRHDGITKELIDKIPGRQTDRKTPLGELNWIFTAITDTVAWNVLPRALFQKLFRSDLLVASLFRNFLLAERIMTAVGCSPMSLPRLPPTHHHPMWQAWDMAAEMCLMQLPTLLSDPAAEFQPSPFFSEQLTAFELWLSSGSRERAPPEQLPIVLQVLLSQVHRLRALVLLGRFLDMGSWAVDLALSVGIFPYVLKLLQTTSQDLRATLVFIWAKILALDKSCQVDLIKDTGHTYFIRYLDSPEASVEPQSRAQATFVLSVICDGHSKGQSLCSSNGLLTVLLRGLRTYFPPQVSYPPGHVLLLKWLCLCLGKLCQDSPEISLMAIREGAADLLVALIVVAQPEIRAAAVFGLGCLVYAPGSGGGGAEAVGVGPAGHMGQGGPSPLEDRMPAEQLIANAVRQVVYDPSVLVRCELAVLYAKYVRGHATQVQDAIALQQRKLIEFARQHLPTPQLSASISDGVMSAEAEGTSRGSNQWRGSDVSTTPDGHPSSLPRPGRMTSDQASAHEAASLGNGSGVIDRQGSVPLPGLGQGQPVVGRAVSAIYTAMVESMQLLALDPSPRVASLGRQVLRIAQCELSFVAPSVSSAQGGAQSPHNPASGALGAFAQKLRRPGWVSARSSISQPQPMAPAQGHTQLGLGQRPSGGMPGTARSPPPGGVSVPGSTTASNTGSAQAAGGGVPVDPAMQALLELQTQYQTALYSVPSTPSHTSSPSSPVRDMVFSRPPYVLCCKNDPDPWPRTPHMYGGPISTGLHGGISQRPASPASSATPPVSVSQPSALTSQAAGQQQSVGSSVSRPIGAQMVLSGDSAMGGYGSVSGQPGHVGGGGQPAPGYSSASVTQQGLLEPLPTSRVYRLSCEAFARPLLEPGASGWRDSGGSAAPHWTSPPDLKRRQERINVMQGSIARCKLTQPKLREQVFSVDTQGDGLAKVCFHPYHNLLVCADALGYLRVMPYDTPGATKPIHTFHVSNGAPPGDARVLPTAVTHLQHITEADGPLLLTGAADGAVRIWRSHAVTPPGPAPTMATAMQAVTINLPPGTGRSTCYAWAGARCQLMAAGGSHPDMVYCWDMAHEMCAVMIPMSSTPHSPSSPNPYVDSLHLGVADPNLLLAACNDHALRLFDVRAPRMPVLTLMPFKAQLAGVALEPAGRPGMLVAASEKGELVLLDSRAALNAQHQAQQLGTPLPGLAELSAAATSKAVAAHSKGGVSCLVAHSCAPLLATGTSNQVVKVWTDQCEVVGAIRATTSAPQKAAGTVSCMAWHPYQPLLVAGGYDSVATVYAIEQATGSLARDSQRFP